MRHDLRYETKRITRTRRTGTSRNGNPNFEVYFEDATAARTQTDAACAYGIENREVLHPNWVRVGFTRDDRIATVEPTEAPQR